jgi:hypothetical protein
MARINRHRWMVAGIAAVLAIVAGARDAHAGVSLSNGTITQVNGGGNQTDPYYIYEFQAVLGAGQSIDAYPPVTDPVTSFTIGNFVSFATPDPTGNPPIEPFTFSGPGTYSFIATPSGSEVTWTYFGASVTAPQSSSLVLGTFEIISQNYTNPLPASSFTPLSYTASLDGATASNGSLSLTQIGFPLAAAPEPSSLIAPLMVLLGLPVVGVVKRWRQRRERVA